MTASCTRCGGEGEYGDELCTRCHGSGDEPTPWTDEERAAYDREMAALHG